MNHPAPATLDKQKRKAHGLQSLGVVRALLLVLPLLLTLTSSAQPLDARLDEDQFLRGLIELQLPEVLQHYIQSHPPADSVQEAYFMIAADRMALNAPSLSATAREATMVQLLSVRWRLIQGHNNDSRRPIWIGDQAADLFFVFLPLDASGLTTLFGLPTSAQRQLAQNVGRQMNELATQAELSVAQVILDIEATPGFSNDPSLQRRRRDLTENQRDRRIPFLRGIGAFLHAELNITDQADRKKLFTIAVDSLEPLSDRLEGSLAVQAKLYTGLAKASLGNFDAAEADFAHVAGNLESAAADVFAARMGGVMNRVVRGGASTGLEALNSIEPRYLAADVLFFRVLIADQRFLLRLSLAKQASAEQRVPLTVQAFSSYIDLLTAEFTPTVPAPASAPVSAAPVVSREVIRAVVFSRLVTAVQSLPSDWGVSFENLPPIIAIARADQLSRANETREEAILLLEAALKKETLAGSDRASALFVLAKALFEHDQQLLAAERFIELAEKFPADNQAERSIELGVTIAADLHHDHPFDEEAHEVLRRGLSVLLQRYVNLTTIDRWRYTAGRLAIEEDKFDDAIGLFAKVTPDSDEWLDAHYMQAATARMKATKASEANVKTFNESAIALIDKVQPLLATGLRNAPNPQRAAAIRYYLASLRVLRAEALLDLNQPQQTIDALKGIEDDRTLEGRVIGEALKVRINAYQALKRPEDALHDIEQFIKAAPDQAGGVLGPMLAALELDVQALIEDNREKDAVELAQRTVLPVAKLLDQWLASRIQSPVSTGDVINEDVFAGRIADAYRLSNHHESALVWYDRALKKKPDAAELLMGKAECLFNFNAIGTANTEQRLGDAMVLYKRLAAAGIQGGRDQYWLSQLRMLQIIDQVNKHTEQIVPRIERLRQQDAKLGGERFRRGFDVLRGKYAR